MKLLSISRLASFALGLFLSAQLVAQDINIESLEGRAGYSIGVNIGSSLSESDILSDLELDSLIAGLMDAVSGELKMSDEEMMVTIQEFTVLQQAKAVAAMELEAQAGQNFLISNATQEGVMTTASGLQYIILEEAADVNARKPSPSDTVSVHYHGTLIDGTVFDSSVERNQPAEFVLNQVIPGWTEGLQLMRVGDKFRFFIPSDLAYGPSGSPPVIGPGATLIFDVELLAMP